MEVIKSSETSLTFQRGVMSQKTSFLTFKFMLFSLRKRSKRCVAHVQGSCAFNVKYPVERQETPA